MKCKARTDFRGGLYHGGCFATVREVVNPYDTLGLHLSEQEKTDLVEYLKSL